jgi:hypothetical protein
LQTAEENVIAVEQVALQAEQAHLNLIAQTDKTIQKHIKKGFKAKIDGHHIKSLEKIREACLSSKKVNWKLERKTIIIRRTTHTKPSDSKIKYQEAQVHVEQAQQKLQELHSSIQQKHSALIEAQNQLNQQAIE